MTRLLIRLLCVAWATGGLAVAQQVSPANEYEVKTAFVYNIAKLVEWPAHAWSSTNAPVRFGFVGDEPTATFIKDAFADRYVQDRKVEAFQIKNSADVATCHVLFVHRDESRRLPKILEALKGRPVLVIGDSEESGAHGVAIHFVTVDGKVRFVVHRKEAEEHGLVISSKLIRLAVPAKNETKEGDR